MRLVRGYDDWCDHCSIFKKFLKQVCYILEKDIIYVSKTYLQIPPPVPSPSLIKDSALSLTVLCRMILCCICYVAVPQAHPYRPADPHLKHVHCIFVECHLCVVGWGCEWVGSDFGGGVEGEWME